MSEEKPEKNPTYPLGTLLWVKLLNRVWWPGTVVDRYTIPQELLDYVKKVEPISAVVKFEQDEKYHVVGLYDEVYLYSCDRKMEFVEKGFSLYKNQMKGLPVIGKYDMNNFKNEVISMERLIGGDICIFENLKEKIETVKSIVKQFFTPTNTKKYKKKEVERKSLPVPKISKTPNQPKPKPISKPSTSTQSRVGETYKPTTSTQSQAGKTYKPTTSTGYSCHSQVGCNFTTNRYYILKRHMASHTNSSDVVTTKKSQTSSTPKNKRKNLKTKPSEVKKQKLQEELLKDWDNDGEDEDEVLDISRVQSSSNVAQSSNEEVLQTMIDVQSSDNVVQSSNEESILTSKFLSSKNDVIQTISVKSSDNVLSSNEETILTSKVVSSKSDVIQTISVKSSGNVVQSSNEETILTSKVLSSKNDVIQTISVKSSGNVVQSSNEETILTSKVLLSKNDVIQTISEDISRNSEVPESSTSSPNQVFDFKENDNNTPVVELRHSKSNCSSTMDDDISETFESRITPDFLNNTTFDATPSESLLVEKSAEDFIVKPHGIHSDEIDNQTKSTDLLLEKTINTLDQISNFENSLSCISSSKNNSDILTEDDNAVISVSELSECGSLNKTASLYTVNDMETNDISIPLVENLSTETEDHAIVKENTNDKEIVSNDKEVNQLNGTTIDKNITIENSCSVDSTSNKIDCEDEITKKKEGIDGIPNIKCFENEEWKHLNSELTKATFITIEHLAYVPPTIDALPTNIDLETDSKSSESCTFRTEIQDTKQPVYIYGGSCDIFIPIDLYESPEITETLTPNVNPVTDVDQTAASEKSVLPET